MFLLLRESPLGPLRGPLRKPARPRGATRVQTSERRKVSLRLPVAWLRPAAKGAAVLLTLFAVQQAGQQLAPALNPSITQVSLMSDSSFISRTEVEERLALPLDAGYFSVDLNGIRQSLESLPWVADVEVRRMWPDQLEVRLTGQLPLARWGEDSLISNRGEIFRPSNLQGFAELPQLIGPAGREAAMMKQFHLFSRLLQPTGLQISRLELHERGSWFIGTRQGVELLLGRDHLAEKLRRLIKIYNAELHGRLGEIARIDLRYSNGLAVAGRDGLPLAPRK